MCGQRDPRVQGISLSDVSPGFDLTTGLKIQSQLQGECVCVFLCWLPVGNVGLGDRKDSFPIGSGPC